MVKKKTKEIASKELEPVKEEAKEAEVKEVEVVSPGGLRRIKVTPDELMKLQAEKKLVGYDPVKEEAIIK